jgi:hypothetical protein
MADRSDDQLLTASDATRELARLGVDLSAASVKRFADLGQIPSLRTRGHGVRLFRASDLAAFAKARLA